MGLLLWIPLIRLGPGNEWNKTVDKRFTNQGDKIVRLNRIICLVAVTGICTVQAAEKTYDRLRGPDPSAVMRSRATGQNDFQWQGRVAAGRAIEINGIFGNIRAEATSGSEVEVIANKHSRRSNPDEVQIRVLNHDGGVTICAVYPRGDPGEPNDCHPGGGNSHTHNNDVRVDFTVRVPSDVRLVARTVDGDVDAESLNGEVEACSVLGNIRISTAGYARAKTVTGSITASLGDANWPGQIAFETITGEISVKLPANLNTEVHAESTVGNISTEFPLTVQGSLNRQAMNGTIGNGGRKLVLKTISGPIRLLRAT